LNHWFIEGTTVIYPAEELKRRSKDFAIRVVELSQALPNTREAWVLGKQVLRSGTSVAANYRAACRARSKPGFVAKIGIVVEEIDETVFWLELFAEAGVMLKKRMEALLGEANELLAIFAASQHTAEMRAFSMNQ
jgi:four helix bundle protein